MDIAALLGLTQPQQAQQPMPVARNAAQPTNDTGQPNLMDQWQSAMQDPNLQAAMLSAGLSMLTPQWGGIGAQVARGVGAGAETYADREQAQAQLQRQAQGDAERKSSRAEARSDKALDRAQALEIAKMNNQTRMSLGNLRGGATGGKNTAFNYFKELLELNTDPIGNLKDGVTVEDLRAQAAEMAAQDRASATAPNANGASNSGPAGALPNAADQTDDGLFRAGPNSQTNSSVPDGTTKAFRNKATGKEEMFIRKNGAWVKQ